MKTKKKSWTVYMIETLNGKLYTGVTTDIERRFLEHSQSLKGAKFFKISAPKKVVYREQVKNRSLAQKKEAMIKKMSRDKKLKLIDCYRENKENESNN